MRHSFKGIPDSTVVAPGREVKIQGVGPDSEYSLTVLVVCSIPGGCNLRARVVDSHPWVSVDIPLEAMGTLTPVGNTDPKRRNLWQWAGDADTK